MNINISEEVKTRESFIDFILNDDFYKENFCRYSIEVFNDDKLITTRFWKDDGVFSISFITQYKDTGGHSWEDANDKWIEYVKGDLSEIETIITEEVFSNIIPTMKNIL